MDFMTGFETFDAQLGNITIPPFRGYWGTYDGIPIEGELGHEILIRNDPNDVREWYYDPRDFTTHEFTNDGVEHVYNRVLHQGVIFDERTGEYKVTVVPFDGKKIIQTSKNCNHENDDSNTRFDETAIADLKNLYGGMK